MKAEDLMIGDFVKHSESDIVGKVIMINTNPDGVHYHGKSITIQNGQVLYSGNENLFEPIPITPDMLDKNGFEQHINALRHPQRTYFELADWSVGWCVHLYPMPNCKYFLETSARMERTIAKTTTAKVIEYVHELQHALKYSEIEKEVVL